MTNPDRIELSHERLDVYQSAVRFLVLVLPMISDLPRGQTAIGDQLRRAAQSIPLNVAEGCGRTGEHDAARHDAIARGSALECAAALDVLRVMGGVAPAHADEARAVLVRIVQMLSKMRR